MERPRAAAYARGNDDRLMLKALRPSGGGLRQSGGNPAAVGQGLLMIHARPPARRDFAVVGLTRLRGPDGVRWPATTVEERQHLVGDHQYISAPHKSQRS